MTNLARRLVVVLVLALAVAATGVAGATAATTHKPKTGKWSGSFKATGPISKQASSKFETAKVSFKVYKKHRKIYAKGRVKFTTLCDDQTAGPHKTVPFKTKYKGGQFQKSKNKSDGTGYNISLSFISSKKGGGLVSYNTKNSAGTRCGTYLTGKVKRKHKH